MRTLHVSGTVAGGRTQHITGICVGEQPLVMIKYTEGTGEVTIQRVRRHDGITDGLIDTAVKWCTDFFGCAEADFALDPPHLVEAGDTPHFFQRVDP